MPTAETEMKTYCACMDEHSNTSMRPVEVKHLRRCDVDLVKRLLYVRRSKNETSHRVIPLNASAIEAAARMFERADLLGHTEGRTISGRRASGGATTPRSRC